MCVAGRTHDLAGCTPLHQGAVKEIYNQAQQTASLMPRRAEPRRYSFVKVDLGRFGGRLARICAASSRNCSLCDCLYFANALWSTTSPPCLPDLKSIHATSRCVWNCIQRGECRQLKFDVPTRIAACPATQHCLRPPHTPQQVSQRPWWCLATFWRGKTERSDDRIHKKVRRT